MVQILLVEDIGQRQAVAPGIGGLVYGAILDRDYPLLQGATITLAAGVLALNWLIDAALAVLAERG